MCRRDPTDLRQGKCCVCVAAQFMLLSGKACPTSDTNAVYIAEKKLSWDDSIPGAGAFDLDESFNKMIILISRLL